MRVLWFSHFIPYPPAGGALQRSYNLLRHAAMTNEVDLLAFNQPRLLPNEKIPEAERELGRFCRSVTVRSIPAERSSLTRLFGVVRAVASSEPHAAMWLRDREMKRTLSRRMGSWDLIHVDTIGLWPYVEGYAGAVRVLVHHNIESDLAARRATHTGGVSGRIVAREARKLRTLEKTAASYASVNVVVSRLDRDRLLALAGDAYVDVVENGVDIEYWRPAESRPEDSRIVFAGTLGWYPNRDAVEFLLGEIWPRLARDRPDRRLLLVGRDPPRSARRAAADPRVTVTGAVPDVRPYLDSAGIFVCPIRVGGGTRLKVLDALAMTKPVIATAIAVEGLDLVPGEHFLPAETAEEFVRQVERLEASPELRRNLGVAGRALVTQRYGWAASAQKLLAAYARARERADQEPQG